MSDRAYRIGLTGGIASGKSTVSAVWKELGAVVLDADEISRSALDVGTSCYDAVRAHFGDEILKPGGRMNRAEIARRVFADEKELEFLNGVIHPYVYSAMRERSESCTAPAVVWDVPLLIESGNVSDVNAVVLVVSDEKERVRRIMSRDKCSEAEAKARIAAQLSDGEKRRYADIVIDNDGDIEQLKSRARQVYTLLCGIATKPKG